MNECLLLMLIILGTLLYLYWDKRLQSHFTVNLPDPVPTTEMELISGKIYEIITMNAIETKNGYPEFMDALKRAGISHPKIDFKFYFTIEQAYRNRLLTRDFIMNRLRN
jgi:hypothetical protein